MTTTTTYRHWVVRQRGGPEVLDLTEAATAPPAAGQVRVRTVAAGVAFGDVLARRGAPGLPKPPYVPGYDVVGVVDALGAGVTGLRVGQTVASLVVRGGYAESVHCPAEATVPVPDGVDPVEAAAVTLNYLVAHQMLHRVVGARPGQRVLVHSAAGGVGTALLDLCQAADVAAIGTTSAGKQNWVRDYGATAVDHNAEDFVARVSETGGVDAAFDPIGGTHWLRSYRCLRPGGHLVMYGASDLLSRGALPTLGALALVKGRAMATRRRATFYNVVERRSGRNPHLVGDLAELFDRLARRDIRPLVAARIPFEQAPHAQEMLESRAVAGKIVLTMSA